MLYQIIGISLCAPLLIASLYRGLSLFSMPVLTSGVWLMVFGTGILLHSKFYSLTSEVFIAWLIWFSITGYLSFLVTPARSIRVPVSEFRRLPFGYSYLMYGLIAWLCYEVWVVGTAGPNHFFLNLRLSSNGLEGYESLGVIVNVYPIIFALFVFEHIYPSKRNKQTRRLTWVWLLLYAVATMGKFAVITPVITWLVLRDFKRKVSWEKLALIGISASILMLLLHFVRASEDDTISFIGLVGTYVYSPIVALGYFDPHQVGQIGPNVFRIFYAIGNRVGLADDPVDVILEYVNVPNPTNVYSVLYPFLFDFGLIGVALGGVLYLLIFTPLFYCATHHNRFCQAAYALLSICLVAQFISELFLTMISGFVQTALAICLLFYISLYYLK